MLGKLINNQLVYVPSTYKIGDVTISNYNLLPEEDLKSHGWKEVVFSDPPELPEGDQGHYEPVYFDDGEVITVSGWEYVPYVKAPDIYEHEELFKALLGDVED